MKISLIQNMAFPKKQVYFNKYLRHKQRSNPNEIRPLKKENVDGFK